MNYINNKNDNEPKTHLWQIDKIAKKIAVHKNGYFTKDGEKYDIYGVRDNYKNIHICSRSSDSEWQGDVDLLRQHGFTFTLK